MNVVSLQTKALNNETLEKTLEKDKGVNNRQVDAKAGNNRSFNITTKLGDYLIGLKDLVHTYVPEVNLINLYGRPFGVIRHLVSPINNKVNGSYHLYVDDIYDKLSNKGFKVSIEEAKMEEMRNIKMLKNNMKGKSGSLNGCHMDLAVESVIVFPNYRLLQYYILGSFVRELL